MSTTVIVLIVIGLIFIFVSFALSEKLSEEKEESAGVVKIPKELTQEQGKNISQEPAMGVMEEKTAYETKTQEQVHEPIKHGGRSR